ncbi:hypothetical protein [Carnobacterium funditum]|uniref:hypothetical protein n=1 Tax=Carnobacterium funditum TaxID=2752 RepID=UPI000554B77D|nr:hypothetical protein [Carnobacterium funditum]
MNKKVMLFFAAAFVLGGCGTQTTEEPMVESSDSVAQSSEEGMTESIAVGSSAGIELATQDDEDRASC